MAVTRIVLLGKAGSGKTSLRRTLLGEMGESNLENNILTTVVDTPGFFDETTTEETLKNETVKSLTHCGPGPHAFLIVLKVDRYTVQNEDIINKILTNFSEEVLKYSIIVFTHGERLNPGGNIEDFVGTVEGLSELVQKCGGRCHIVDNKYWNDKDDEYRNNKFQVTQLLNTIEQMKQSGGYYTNQKNKKNDFINRLLCGLIGTIGGTLLGAIFGAALCQTNRVKTRFGAGVGALFGACIGYGIGEQATTPGDAALKTLETVSAVGKGFIQVNNALQSGSSKDKND